MIEDIEFHFEHVSAKHYRMIAVLGHVLVMYEIDELEDPYCLANLLAFSQTLDGGVGKAPIGKPYKKHWNPIAPIWVAYESEKRYTWAVRQPDLDGDLIELNIKSGLPHQTKPETKISLKLYLPEFICAIQMGLGRRVQPIYPDTA